MNILKNWKQHARLALTGFGMGAADLVPGVSGGTIAFIFGIYEELMQSIKTVSGETLKLILKGKFKDAWDSIPFKFLIPLAAGLGLAIILLSSLIEFLLAEYPVYIWSFFFGLVIASVIVISQRIVKWDVKDVFGAISGAIAAFLIVGAVPVETPANPIAFFLAGFIAICAMILPGISGSFLLLIMGKYEQVLAAVNDRDFVTVGLVGLGAIFGLAIFARFLSWLFKNHHNIVVAILTGFMVGSLRKIWPWKEVVQTRINSHGVEEAFLTRNILPTFDFTFFIAIFIALIGIVLILLLEKINVVEEHVKDIEDKEFEKAHKKALESQE